MFEREIKRGCRKICYKQVNLIQQIDMRGMMSTFSEKRKVLRNGLTRATLKVLRNMRNCCAIFIQDRFLQVSGALIQI